MLYFSKSSSTEQSIARNNESFHVFSQRLLQNNLLANVNLNIYMPCLLNTCKFIIKQFFKNNQKILIVLQTGNRRSPQAYTKPPVPTGIMILIMKDVHVHVLLFCII